MTTLLLLALLQTTTTVTTEPQQPPPPPPPAAGTQVVVQPGEPGTVTPVVPATTEVQTVPTGRSAVGIVAVDALYGGFAGALVGGGVTLIDQGDHWQRDLMVGAGVGILAGAAFGVFEAATQPATTTVRHAEADPSPGTSNTTSFAMTVGAGRF